MSEPLPPNDMGTYSGRELGSAEALGCRSVGGRAVSVEVQLRQRHVPAPRATSPCRNRLVQDAVDEQRRCAANDGRGLAACDVASDPGGDLVAAAIPLE